MTHYQIKARQVRELLIAADARLTETDYCDDQSWSLRLAGGEPPALALETTYGLRINRMSLFPRFVEGRKEVVDPADYELPPSVKALFPNYLSVNGKALAEIEFEIAYWLAHSNALAIRMKVTNRSTTSRHIQAAWCGLMTGEGGDQLMVPGRKDGVSVLVGSTEEIGAVLFCQGGGEAVSSPFPALIQEFSLEYGESRQMVLSLATLADADQSFHLARATAGRKWEAELARVQLINASHVEIQTGDAEWTAALNLAQKCAYQTLLSSTSALPHASLVGARDPDRGYSRRGDGMDYGPMWNGQTPFETYSLHNLLLPGAAPLVRGLLLNFLSATRAEGEIDHKPGLAGQRSNFQAAPLLVELTWRYYQQTADLTLLQEMYTPLLAYYQAWFKPAHDRDQDGIPEWDNSFQAGLGDHPLFSRWHTWGEGLDISSAESPGLCAMLYKEGLALMEMGKALRIEAAPAEISANNQRLMVAVQDMWNPDIKTYTYRERETHSAPGMEMLGQREGSGMISVQQAFSQPVRLTIQIASSSETTRRAQAFLHGTSQSGKRRRERFNPTTFSWIPGWATATSQQVYTGLEYLEIEGLTQSDTVSLKVAGYASDDLSCLLPLWAEMASEEQARAVVENSLFNPQRYLAPSGLRLTPFQEDAPSDHSSQQVEVLWNILMGEGLLAYGYRSQAVDLFTRLMTTIIASLRNEGAFRQHYHAESGSGSGARHALAGIIPVGLFLKILGVQIFSPNRLQLEGFNPFPWPVTVKYRGLKLQRESESTQVTFPGGQSIKVSDPAPRMISME